MVTAKTAAKAVGLMVFIGLLSKIFGFFREMVVAHHYGATASMDAFNIASGIPGILLAVLGSAIATTFVPAFIQKKERESQEAAYDFSRKIFTAFTILGIVICAFGIILSFPFAKILAPKFSLAKISLTAGLSKVLLVVGVFTILNSLCIGILQAQERFIIPTLAGFPINITVILVVMLFDRQKGIYALAIGTALSIIVQVLFFIPPILRLGFNFKPSFDFRDPDLRRMTWLVVPVFLATMIFQVNIIVDRIFASGLPEGSIAALGYASKINNLIISLVATAISTVALPALSVAAANRDINRLRMTMVRAIQAINTLIIPMTFGMIILRIPIIQLFYQRGAFDAKATETTALALLFLSPGLFAYGLRDVISRVFFAQQDTTTPMINSGIMIVLNITLLYYLVPIFGLAGLAGATSISAIFGGLQLLFVLRRKIGSIGGRLISISFIKVLLASSIMGLSIKWLYPLIHSWLPGTVFLSQSIALVILSIFGFLLYLLSLYLFKAEEIQFIRGILKQITQRIYKTTDE